MSVFVENETVKMKYTTGFGKATFSLRAVGKTVGKH